MQLFYCPDISNEIYSLSEEESKHCIRVLRLKNGDFIHITNGTGDLFKTELIDDHPKRCKVKIVETTLNYNRPDCHLQLAVAPTKNNNRYEWFLEKATEIGISTIVPIICEHSERREIKIDRMDKIIVSAIKQSLKAYKPIINEAKKLKDFLKEPFAGQKFIAYCEGKPKSLKDIYKKGSDVLILIGPEGDFSSEEVEIALKNGFQVVSLGESRLRTETAALVACHTINLMNE